MADDLQPAVRELMSVPNLRLSDALPQADIDRWVALFDQIKTPLSDADSVALVDVLSRSDDDMFEANWTLLHAIETAPSWPDWNVLDRYNGWWSNLLRQRCLNTSKLGKDA